MSQSVYSYMGSPLHLVLEDELAEGFNRFVDAFIQAQEDHKERTGQKWEPNEPLLMDVQDGDHDAYDKVGRVINLLVEINGGGLHITEEQITSDHLEKI